MSNRFFLILSGLICSILIFLFSYSILNSTASTSLDNFFNKKDRNVFVINRFNEYLANPSIVFTTENNQKIISHFDSINFIAKSLYISGETDKISVESSFVWNKNNVKNFLSTCKIPFKEKDSKLYVLEKYHVSYLKNLLFFQGSTSYKKENIKLGQRDKLASINKLQLYKNHYQSTDVYINKTGIIAYNSLGNRNVQGKKVDDFRLFASVIPSNLSNYHFFNKEFSVYLGVLIKNSPLYKWMDKGFVSFEYEGIPVYISDINNLFDPFEILNEETEEEELIAGIRKHYTNIDLLNNQDLDLKKEFYIDQIDDKVIFCSNKDIIRRVLTDYETGNTLQLNIDLKKKYFGLLPNTVSERSFTSDFLSSRSVQGNKIISVVLKKEYANTKKEEKRNYESIAIEDPVKLIVGENNNVFVFTENNKIFCIEDSKIKWEKAFKGDLVGEPLVNIIKSNRGVTFLTTTTFYSITEEGVFTFGSPVTLRETPVNQLSYSDLSNSGLFTYVSLKNDLIRIDLKGRVKEKIPLKVEKPVNPFYFFKNRNVTYGLIYNEQMGNVLNFKNFKKVNSYELVNQNIVFLKRNNSPVLCYFKGNTLIYNQLNGGIIEVDKFINPRKLKSDISSNLSFLSQRYFNMISQEGKQLLKIELPSQKISDFQLLYLPDGGRMIALFDDVNNDVFIYHNSKLLTEKPLEGKEIINLSTNSEGVVVTTKGRDYLIQYVINI